MSRASASVPPRELSLSVSKTCVSDDISMYSLLLVVSDMTETEEGMGK